MPGWTGSRRRLELPANWETIRLAVLRRDGYRCQHIRFDTGDKCGRYANQADHIDNRDSYDLVDLQSLCKYHHQEKSSREGGQASQAARRRRWGKPVKPLHPGILP
jgi:5-methylcytosine-specific restriction protein A